MEKREKAEMTKSIAEATMMDILTHGMPQVTISVLRFEQLLKAECERNMARNIYMNNESWNVETLLSNLFGSRHVANAPDKAVGVPEDV